MKTLPYKIVNDLLSYNPITGDLRWKIDVPRQPIKAGSIAGCLDNKGYRVITINGIQYKAHRLAWLIIYGEWPKHEIDHKNGSKDDNSKLNMRDVSRRVNSWNRKMSARNKYGIVGVGWKAVRARWVSTIMVKGKEIYLYSGKDFFKACCARKSAEISYGFHANHGT